jgi:protocatechuate 4,5-dioxygenase alpha chain
MASTATKCVIPGTPVFDGDAAQRGYALNAMCYSFNEAGNRQAFLADEDAYCARFGLDPEHRRRNRAVADRSGKGRRPGLRSVSA